MSNQDQEKNIAQGLSQLGETTTAAELLRQKGQTKKLRVISEKQLMDWILKLMQQHMAGKADAFSDLEKAELLKKTQDELNRRIKREQEAQSERDRLKHELEQAMSAVAAGSSAQSQADIEMALGALKEKLEQAEQINLDLQQDNYDLQDQLNEKMALLSTTIAEKDKLRDTVRAQMMRMTSLCEGVLGIDNDYYGSRHQEENPVSEEASQDEQFYHDFDVGAKVITTLQADLERLRGIVKREEQDAAVEHAQEEKKSQLLEADLALLEQLKSGSLHAVDVAAPVAGLLEAMEGARLEAEAFEVQAAEATGAGHGQSFTELPEEGGDPAEVLAGATAVARELAASLARNRNRIAALKSIADESDSARNATEQDLEATRAALERVCAELKGRAEAERLAVPAALADSDAAPDSRADAVSEIVSHLQAASPVDAAAIEQLELTDRLTKGGASSEVKTTDKQLVAERLRKAGAELERYTLDLQRQLDEASARERTLAEQVAKLAHREGEESTAAVAELERSLEVKADPQVIAMVTARALDEVAGKGGRTSSINAAFAEDRSIAVEIIKASKGDDAMTDMIADLAIAAETDDVKSQPQLGAQVREAVAALGARKRELEGRVLEMAAAMEQIRAEHGRGSGEAQRLLGDLEKAKADLQKAQNETLRLRSGRDAANGAIDAIANELKRRVPDAHPDLMDRASEPQARAAAAAAALAKLAEHRAAESAAIDAVAAIDRAMARTGAPTGLAANLTPGDEAQIAAKLRESAVALEARLSAIGSELETARSRERELARQVRDLSAAHAVSSPSAAPKDEIARLDKALAENAGAVELGEATKRLLTGLKAKAGKSEAEARGAAARAIAGEVLIAAQGDQDLADQTADLALALDNPDADPAEVEAQARAAVARLAARKRALEGERVRLSAELAKHDQRKGERSLETGRHASELGRLKVQNVALRTAIDQLTTELAQRSSALGREVPAALTDPAAEPEMKASAALAAVSGLADHRQIEDAAVDHLQMTERLLASTDGPKSGLSEGLKPGDEQALAERLRRADSTLDRHVRDLHQRVDSARLREHDLAKQVRELAVSQSAAGTPAVARDDLHRLEKAIADPASSDIVEASRKVVAALKANAGKAESEARGSIARSLADELIKAGENDPSLVETTTALSASLGSGAAEDLENDLRQAVLRLAARKRVVDADRARLAADLETVRAERIAALGRAEQAENERRDEIARLSGELAAMREDLESAQADASEFRARNEATGSQFSGEMLALRQELTGLRSRHQEQTSTLASLRQQVEASDARLKRQREELTKGLEERDNLIAEKDRTIDQLSTQRIDAKSIQAKVQALSVELDAANARIRELESRSGDQAGAVVRSGDLAELHKRTMGERDQLREQKRRLESDLADTRGSIDELKTELSELRREHQTEIELHAKEVAEERDKNAGLYDMVRKLREEVVGMKARNRKPIDGKLATSRNCAGASCRPISTSSASAWSSSPGATPRRSTANVASCGSSRAGSTTPA